MGETTEIAWCDSTFNPWTGCSKVSPGCANCYAERMAKRFPHLGSWGPGAERKRTSPANWRKPLTWSRKAGRAIDASEEFLAVASGDARWDGGLPLRPRVFCGSLCDWLDPEVPAEWLADLLALIAATPHLDWLLLTKRPEMWRDRLGESADARTAVNVPGAQFAECWLAGDAPENVWIGTTAEDQKRADERIPELLKIPARIRFLSCEPLLGAVGLGDLRGIHWVICGGESGPGARPCRPEWARSLRDQCRAIGVPFMLKQWGAWKPLNNESTRKDAEPWCERVGKKIAGRLLDGVTHNDFPS